jgi:hypothetical protein
MKKIIDGVVQDLTEQEIAQRNADDIKHNARQQAKETARQNAKAKKTSGKQKLKDLGLDDDEIKALIGV